MLSHRDPVALTGLIESILLTHQPTWDECQLLQALLTSEERQRVMLKARGNAPEKIDAAFPLTRPDWGYNTTTTTLQLVGRDFVFIARFSLQVSKQRADAPLIWLR